MRRARMPSHPRKRKTPRIRDEGRLVLLRSQRICEARSAPIAMRIAECLRVFAGLRVNDRRPGTDESGSVQRILSSGDGLCAVVSAMFERPTMSPAVQKALREALCGWWVERGNFINANTRAPQDAGSCPQRGRRAGVAE